MTGLVFILTRDMVYIGMDTLAIYADNKSPFKYCSKIFLVPHLASAICVTGSHRLGVEWYSDVQLNVLARDIDYVNQIASGRLRSIASRLAEPGTSTVYHFGFSPSARCYVGSAFRSTHSFALEMLPYGIGIKPPFQEVVASADADLETLGIESGITAILRRLRELDDALPIAERVGIGGELHLLTMVRSSQAIHTVERWPDFELQFREMLKNLQERNASSGSDHDS